MQRLGPPTLSFAGIVLACGLCAACTDRQLIDHPGETFDSAVDDWGGTVGDSSGPVTATSAFGDSTSGFEPATTGLDATATGVFDSTDAGFADTSTTGDDSGVGNFPDPAIAECGDLPAGVDPIPGLATAWAVTGNAPGMDREGNRFPDDLVRLRFADYGAGCDESFVGVSRSCTNAWNFALSLAVLDLAPGVYDLPTLANLHPEFHMSIGDGIDCGGEEAGGGGPGPGAEPSGELEIFSVTDDCVLGELRGLANTSGDLDIDRNGGFVAMRCESDCVPMPDNGCGQ
jgi:hypothetical protein